MDVIVYEDADRILQECLSDMSYKTGIPWHFDDEHTFGGCHIGVYCHKNDFVSIGGKSLAQAKEIGVLSCVNFVSIRKQMFHEYRHWEQYHKMYSGVDTCGLSENVIKHMARQSLINRAFPMYLRDNYSESSAECDAEEYAIINVREDMKRFGFSSDFTDKCIVQEIERRDDWWGHRPLSSVEAAIDDLHCRKLKCVYGRLHSSITAQIARSSPICKTWFEDNDALAIYSDLSDEEGEAFLLDYICKHDEYLKKPFKVLKDEFSKLSVGEKVNQLKYRKLQGIPDENHYKFDVSAHVPQTSKDIRGKRMADLDSQFGEMIDKTENQEFDGYDLKM